MIRPMGMGCIRILMGRAMRATGLKINNMDMALSSGLMALRMKDSTRKGRNMGKEISHGQIIRNMKECLLIIIFME